MKVKTYVIEETCGCWKLNMMMKFEQVEIWSQRNLKQKKFKKLKKMWLKKFEVDEIWNWRNFELKFEVKEIVADEIWS